MIIFTLANCGASFAPEFASFTTFRVLAASVATCFLVVGITICGDLYAVVKTTLNFFVGRKLNVDGFVDWARNRNWILHSRRLLGYRRGPAHHRSNHHIHYLEMAVRRAGSMSLHPLNTLPFLPSRDWPPKKFRPS